MSERTAGRIVVLIVIALVVLWILLVPAPVVWPPDQAIR